MTPVTLTLVSAEPGRARPGPAPGAVPRRAPRDIGPRPRGLLASGHQEANGETVVIRWTLAQLLDSLSSQYGLEGRDFTAGQDGCAGARWPARSASRRAMRVPGKRLFSRAALIRSVSC